MAIPARQAVLRTIRPTPCRSSRHGPCCAPAGELAQVQGVGLPREAAVAGQSAHPTPAANSWHAARKASPSRGACAQVTDWRRGAADFVDMGVTGGLCWLPDAAGGGDRACQVRPGARRGLAGSCGRDRFQPGFRLTSAALATVGSVAPGPEGCGHAEDLRQPGGGRGGYLGCPYGRVAEPDGDGGQRMLGSPKCNGGPPPAAAPASACTDHNCVKGVPPVAVFVNCPPPSISDPGSGGC